MLAFSLWNAIWIVFVSFVFIAVLMMMFSVITDIFRDHELSGWGKAAWLIALLFFTFLTLIVYVIVRGDGMVKRSAKEQVEAKQSFDAYVRDVAGGGAASELEKASALHNEGKIDDAEYAALKAKILG
ncbi:MAG: SHOCT domain-containing protein [Ilumatobacter fluminis]|uniref:Phospholipase D-like protein n=1 Tax=Ilumatobacter fluminis TaxID=467091 RepID=A0A4R7I2W8_9ACTN|nr:SHOCT domain-containing protein [Ilumatobacter fluminis]TDT17967.1 phospholipase D-like protein [Ilumatobacter fluminis]